MKLLCDSMLGRLVKYLRLLGIDTLYSNSKIFEIKIELAREEGRVFLSRDTRLLRMKNLPSFYFVRSNFPEEQIYEVIKGLKIDISEFKPFSRCLRCNTQISPIEKEKIIGRIPEYVMRTQQSFSYCAGCDSVYWKATHYERMIRVVNTIISKFN